MVTKNNPLRSLLTTTEALVKEAKLRAIAKGESFNVFSILRVETKENNTHSAFLGELLNPHGSHLKGSAYLALFLKQIGHINFDPLTTQVILEKSIGPKQTFVGAKRKDSCGGRIDIYLEDGKGNIITIENKIYAPEQELQVLRYCNYKPDKNTVYYLTLNGAKPSPKSTLTLEAGRDFYEISYAHDILSWLKACQAISKDQPILHESIRQYCILIKKLTGQMSNGDNKALFNHILNHFEAATTVADHLRDARKSICETIREAVYTQLSAALADKEVSISLGNDVWDRHSQIWVKIKDREEMSLCITLESFSGEGNLDGDLFLGILDPPPHNSGFAELEGNNSSIGNWIINAQRISMIAGQKANLGNAATIQALHTDAEFRVKFIAHLVTETQAYVADQLPAIKEFLAQASSKLTN